MSNDYGHTVGEVSINRMLVVLDEEALDENESGEIPAAESALLQRAVALSRATGCTIELFHAYHDRSVARIFSDPDERTRVSESGLEEAATRLSELAARLTGEGVEVTFDARWDAPRVDAILRKVQESNVDVLMKSSGDHGYFMGALSNTDWDLIRRSPVNVWFVNAVENADDSDIICALGSDGVDEDIVRPEDYDVFRMATFLAGKFGTTTTPMHAYQMPVEMSRFAFYAPEVGGTGGPLAPDQISHAVADSHAKAMESFADYFQFDPSTFQLLEGRPSTVIADQAEKSGAGLVVMSARTLTDWERWVKSVTAEPLLSKAPCDVLFVRNDDTERAPKPEADALVGAPTVDVADALARPAETFVSPAALVRTRAVSDSMKRRLLDVWEHDVNLEMTEADEGGQSVGINPNILAEINEARERLG